MYLRMIVLLRIRRMAVSAVESGLQDGFALTTLSSLGKTHSFDPFSMEVMEKAG